MPWFVCDYQCPYQALGMKARAESYALADAPKPEPPRHCRSTENRATMSGPGLLRGVAFFNVGRAIHPDLVAELYPAITCFSAAAKREATVPSAMALIALVPPVVSIGEPDLSVATLEKKLNIWLA